MVVEIEKIFSYFMWYESTFKLKKFFIGHVRPMILY